MNIKQGGGMIQTCGNCKFMLTKEGNEDDRKWGIKNYYTCGKYEKFVNGLPTLPDKKGELLTQDKQVAFHCRYYKSSEIQ